MELTQLKRFVLVATLLNMHRAAEKAHVSQSALSLSLKNLEDELGFLLFERVGKRLVLTPQGKRFLERVKPLIEELEQVKEQTSRNSKDQWEKVVVVAGAAMIHSFLPYVDDFLSAHSEVDLRLTVECEQVAIQKLENGEADFAVGRYSSVPASLEALPLFSECYVLICNKQSPLRLRGKLALQRIAQLPLCVPTHPSRTYRDIVSTFTSEGLKPQVVFSPHNSWSVREAVRHNRNWVGIVPPHALDDMEQFHIHDLGHLFSVSTMLLVSRQITFSTKARARVYDFLRTLPTPRLASRKKLTLGLPVTQG